MSVGRVTERDLRMVATIARFGFLTVQQVSRWLGEVEGGSAAPRVARHRLQVVREHGLVAEASLLTSHGRVVWATTEGLQAVGIEGGGAHPPRIGQARHDKRVADLCLDMMVSKPTHRLVTERELRRADTPNQHHDEPPVWVSVHPGARSKRIYPDFVTIAPSGGRVVHELETSAKSRARLVMLMLAHLSNASTGSVRYYATPNVMDHVARAAEETRALATDRGLHTPLNVVPVEEA